MAYSLSNKSAKIFVDGQF